MNAYEGMVEFGITNGYVLRDDRENEYRDHARIQIWTGIRARHGGVSLVLPGPMIEDEIEHTEDTVEINHVDMNEKTCRQVYQFWARFLLCSRFHKRTPWWIVLTCQSASGPMNSPFDQLIK